MVKYYANIVSHDDEYSGPNIYAPVGSPFCVGSKLDDVKDKILKILSKNKEFTKYVITQRSYYACEFSIIITDYKPVVVYDEDCISELVYVVIKNDSNIRKYDLDDILREMSEKDTY